MTIPWAEVESDVEIGPGRRDLRGSELRYVRVHAQIAVCQHTRRTLVGLGDELVAKLIALRRLPLARVVQ